MTRRSLNIPTKELYLIVRMEVVVTTDYRRTLWYRAMLAAQTLALNVSHSNLLKLLVEFIVVSDTFANYNFNAFVGIGDSVLDMLISIRSHPLYSFCSDSAIRSIMQEYAWKNPLTVALDRDNIAFDSELVKMMTSEDRESLLEIRVGLDKEDMSIVSDFETLFSNYYHHGSAAQGADVVHDVLLEKVVNITYSKLLIATHDTSGQCIIATEQMNVSTCFFSTQMYYTIQMEIYSSFNENLLNHKWFAGAFNLIVFAEIGMHCTNFQLYIDDLAYRFFQVFIV